MIAFFGMVAAFPSVVSASVCVLNVALFVYMAFDDERVFLRSPLAADYLNYRTRTRMFSPRVRV
jgi:protein-S-isoprenylcysteine O-methyltransferase Ste14